MRILIAGAGAVGGYFGASWARSGLDVTFMVSARRARVLAERGLRVVDMGEESVLTPTTVLAEDIGAPYDLVVLGVKSTADRPFAALLDQIAPAVGPDTLILPLLNGLAHVEVLNERFGPERVLGGVAKIITTLNEDGDIVRMAPVATLVFGEQPGGASERARELRERLSVEGTDIVLSEDILGDMWDKWVFITTTAGLNVLMRAPLGDIAAVPGGPELARRLAAEGASVAKAEGHELSEERIETTVAFASDPELPVTTSLYRDLEAGSATEGEHLFGIMLSTARRHGLEVPTLELVTLNLRVFERSREKAGAR
ncbi:ketopantoate reductase family protein [Salininema proteolyticum]|uniref:2-dehydropantoate 2-reductase n=1 Tax=Salininema proteolyticum TaxID=1607685 RepID=A0ABV8TY33_9ACTN